MSEVVEVSEKADSCIAKEKGGKSVIVKTFERVEKCREIAFMSLKSSTF